jgi:hypothetical protein
VNIGESQIKVEDSPILGPVVIQVGQVRAPETLPVLEASEDRIFVLIEKVDILIDYADSIETILEEIRDLSVPWYLKLWRWLKEKF